MRSIGTVVALLASVACTRAATLAGQGERISVRDPICGFPGARSGSLTDMMPYNDPHAGSTDMTHVVGETVDVDGVRLHYASAVILNTAIGAYADSNGIFRLDVPPGRVVLRVRSVAHLRQDHELHLIGGRTDTLCIRLRGEPVGLAPVGFNDVVLPKIIPPL